MRSILRRAPRALVAPLLAVVALGLVAAPADARPAAHTVPGSRWVRGACGDLSNWIDKTNEVDWAVPSVISRVENGAVSGKSGKSRLEKLYKKAVAASAVLVAHTKALGIPRVPKGKTVAADTLANAKDFAAGYGVGLVGSKRLPTKRKAFVRKASQLEKRVFSELRDVGNPLEPMNGNPTLAAYVSGISSCQDVQAYFTPQAESLGVEPGDCYDEPDGVVPCTQGHDGEVFFVGTYPAAAGVAYPGANTLNEWADQQCTPAFNSYVGIPIDDSQYDFYWYTPTPETWTAGDREVVCFVSNLDSSHLTGSVRNSVS